MQHIESDEVKMKKEIQKLLNEGITDEATKLILKYEEMIKDDIEILSMKAVILIMKNELDEAEAILGKALEMDLNNPDILFNLGYIYEYRKHYDEAYKYYSLAKIGSQDVEFISNVDKIINNLQENYVLDIDDFNNKATKTSIVILTYNKLNYTKLCIDSVRKYTKAGTYEIIVVDNNSTDDTRDWLLKQSDIKVILNDKNLGFPGGCNVGIEAAEKDNNILLLNNDTIVTPRWLENLDNCLYSDEYIGAVGAVSNNCSNYQAIQTEYKSIEEMIDFADKYNISDSTKWEQKVKLVGFCMLIKRQVLNKVGLLDEVFFPGNFEDDDLGYRIQSEGYKLVLCNDTFIHHFGSTSFKDNPEKYNKLLMENSLKFIDKWGFNSEENSFVNHNILNKLDVDKPNINVLHIGCGTGSLLYKIKYKFKNANLYGISNDKSTAEILNNFVDVKIINIDDELDYPKNFFDYIIISDGIQYSKSPRTDLMRLFKFTKETGEIIVTIKNSNFYGEFIKILMGSVDFNGKKLYNYNEIKEMFTWDDFLETTIESETVEVSDESKIVLDYICKLTGDYMKAQYMTKEYLISLNRRNVSKTEIPYILTGNQKIKNQLKSYDEQELKFLLRRIENDIEKEKSENEIIEIIRENFIDCHEIVESIDKYIIKKEYVLNTIAVRCYENSLYENVIPLLQKAYEINSESKDTVYNISYILYTMGQNELALDYLEKISVKDEDIIKLINKIQGDN